MTVSKLIKLLEKENKNAEIFAYLGAKQGWKIQEIGMGGDAIIGKMKSEKESFVLLPIEVPDTFEKWDKP